jgi:drug/metabolite transporter (DMT)-like permease
VVLIAHLTGAVLMVALALLWHDPTLTWRALWWCLGAGLFSGVALASFYRALAIGKMGLNAPVAAVLTGVLPVVASIRTEGWPHALQFAGFALAFVAIWLIAKPEGAAGRPEGLGLAILAGFGFSAFLLLLRLSHASGVFWPVAACRVSSVTVLSLLVFSRFTERKPRNGSFLIAASAGCLDSLGSTFFLLAAQRGRLDVAAVISSLYPAGTVLLARFLLKEHLTRVQILGMTAALIAVPLIAWR